jgi:hypothetical protein
MREQHSNTACLTLAKYERAKLGMSLGEIEAFLGPGEEKNRSTSKITFAWENSDGSKIIGTFDPQSKLISKSQEGLR